MQFGSLINHVYTAGADKVIPTVGMGATKFCWSDRHAYTVQVVLGPKRIMVSQDRAVRTDQNGMSESQSYSFEPNPTAPLELVTLRKDGKWHFGGTLKGSILRLGHRDEYHDYSF